MQLLDDLQTVLILDDSVTTRQQAMDAILQELVAVSAVPASLVPELREALEAREELGSTGIGQGVAIPHATPIAQENLVCALAVSRKGLSDYVTQDNKPVRVLLFFLSPGKYGSGPSKPQMFGTWLQNLRDSSFVNRLKQAKTAEELKEVLREAEIPA
jgi:mannitol/fructose-specific phosphotransferase system IIA component (Ntr-type)